MKGVETRGGWLRPAVLFILLALILSPLMSAGESECRVKFEGASIRSGPGVQNTVIAQVAQGTVLEIVDRSGSWLLVSLPTALRSRADRGYIQEYMIESLAEESAVQRRWMAGGRLGRPPASSRAGRSSFEINLLGGGGYTEVDVAYDLHVPIDWVEDWTLINWRVLAQALLLMGNKFGIGCEFGFTNFYYFYWKSPAYTYGHYGNPQALNLHLVVEWHFVNNFFIQGGGGAFFFEEIGFGFFSAVGGDIPISPNLAIPVMVRFDLIPDGPSPLSLLLGLKIKM